MLSCFPNFDVETISAVVSIATPIILLMWFYHSQRQSFSKHYLEEIDGIYAGYTQPISKIEDKKGLNAGIIMNIIGTDENGYFKGEFDFAETKTTIINHRVSDDKIRDGIHTFIGKLNFELYLDKDRHPFKLRQNRIYYGKLYIVDRLDFQIELTNIETYLNAEYDIIHYREMKVMKFTLSKLIKDDRPELPKFFTLTKSYGLEFEPYKNVKETIFNNRSRVD